MFLSEDMDMCNSVPSCSAASKHGRFTGHHACIRVSHTSMQTNVHLEWVEQVQAHHDLAPKHPPSAVWSPQLGPILSCPLQPRPECKQAPQLGQPEHTRAMLHESGAVCRTCLHIKEVSSGLPLSVQMCSRCTHHVYYQCRPSGSLPSPEIADPQELQICIDDLHKCLS